MRISPASFEIHTSKAFGRIGLAGGQSRARRKETKALHNFAFAAGQAAAAAKPRLIATTRPEPTVFSLGDFFRASLQPVVDVLSVELPPPVQKGIRRITPQSVEQVLAEVLR